MRSARGQQAALPPHLRPLVPRAGPKSRQSCQPRWGRGSGRLSRPCASGTGSARPWHPASRPGAASLQSPRPRARSPRDPGPAPLPPGLLRSPGPLPSPPAPSPAPDLFLRSVESFLDVLGEDARLDVGHGCGSAEAASSRARVGPAAAGRRRTWRGGAGGAGEERRERRGGAGRRRAAASAGSREGGARPGTCLKRQSGGGTRRGWRRRGAGWGGKEREGARSQNAQVVPTVMEQKARRRKGSSRSRTWRQPGFF